MDRYTIAHRWANKDFGRNNTLTGNSVRCEGRNYFSYNTVFGQWVDMKNNVVLIYEGSTSISSSKHQLSRRYFADDVHVFPYDDGAHNSYGYYSYHGCNLVSCLGFDDEEFTELHRMRLLAYFVGEMYSQFENITTSQKKNAEKVSFRMWEYFEELCDIYKDCSAKKFLAKYSTFGYNMDKEKMRKLVNLLAKGKRDVKTITDAMFGGGTYEAYMARSERFRKADKRREQMGALCKRLGIKSPYETYSNGLSAHLTAKQIRNLSAAERLALHWKALAHEEYCKNYNAIENKRIRGEKNAYKWIVGYKPKEYRYGGGYESTVEKSRNMFTGEEYDLAGGIIYGLYWCKTSATFDYDSFCKSEDKEKWIADFYAKCKEVSDNRRAIAILRRVKAHTKEKKRSWGDDIYINDDYLRENTTEEEFNLCAEFIRKQDKHYADEEARRRAAEIARLKREEEERKEREHMENVKREQIEERIKDGSEGCRNLWREHLTSLSESENWYSAVAFKSDGDFYCNGNVLLRLNLNKDKVETSKDIRIPVEICKKMWKIVSKWHENPSCFKEMQIDTKGSGKYTISSYEDDILTAGCHKIAYCEMERVMNEINNIN